LLRDKAALTRLLLLLELQRTTHTRLAGLAERLGMTVQGVSNYIGEAERQGLVRAGRGRYEVTPRGTEVLEEGLAELKGFVDLAYQRLRVVEQCAALAAARVREGDPVGLFMEDGVLVARPRKASPSRGEAAHDAAPGELVRVRALAGLVALRAGRVTVLRLADYEGAGTKGAARALRKRLAQRRPDRLAAADTEGLVLARAAGREPDFRFAPTHAAHHAAQLGLDVLLLAGQAQVRFVAAELERLNEDALEPVRWETRDLRVGR
jgi:putative transcriptional regulator